MPTTPSSRRRAKPAHARGTTNARRWGLRLPTLGVWALLLALGVSAGSAYAYFASSSSGAGVARVGKIAAPTNFGSSAVTSTSVTLSWTAPSTPTETGYTLAQSPGTLHGCITTPAAGTVTCTATTLTPGTLYSWTLHAVYDSWTSTPVTTTATTSAVVTPSGLDGVFVTNPDHAVAVGATGVIYTWGVVPPPSLPLPLPGEGWSTSTPKSVNAHTLNAVTGVSPPGFPLWAVGNTCTFLVSSNGGATWTKDRNVSGCGNVTGVAFQGPAEGWAVTSLGQVLICTANCDRSTATWSVLTGTVGITKTGTAHGSISGAAATSTTLFTSANPSFVGDVITDSLNKLSADTTITAETTTHHTATLSHPAPASLTTDTFTVGVKTPITTALSGVSFTGITETAPNSVYAVGNKGGTGVVFACPNACGSPTAAYVTAPPPPATSTWNLITPVGLTAGLTAISGQGPGLGPLMAVGTQGTILICPANPPGLLPGSCGTSVFGWQKLTGTAAPPTSVTFTSVWVGAPNNALAVTTNGEVWGCSANCVATMASPSTTPLPPANALWAKVATVPGGIALYGVSSAGPFGPGPAWAVGAKGELFGCATTSPPRPIADCDQAGAVWSTYTKPIP